VGHHSVGWASDGRSEFSMKGYERETGGIFLGYHIYSKENHYTWIHLDLYRYGGFLK